MGCSVPLLFTDALICSVFIGLPKVFYRGVEFLQRAFEGKEGAEISKNERGLQLI